MDLELLVSFLEVARLRHFGQAARARGMSQPAMSHQIRRLEDRVGTPLLERTSRSVELTASGRALVPEARRLIAGLDRALARARDAGGNRADRLVLGSIGAGLNSFTPLLIGGLREQVPQVALEVRQLDTPASLKALRSGDIDLAVVRFMGDPGGMQMQSLLLEPLMAAVPSGHALARRRALAIADLRDEEFVMWPREANPWLRDQIVAACRAELFEPKMAIEGADAEALLGLVSAGFGVSLLPLTFSGLARAGVCWRPLQGDPPKSAIQIAWLKPVRTRLIPIAVEVAREAAATWLQRHASGRGSATATASFR
jgi:DNA-binding transcriptional LysR family regulator